MNKSNYVYLGILTLISSVILLIIALISYNIYIQTSISLILVNILFLIKEIKVTSW